MFLSGYWGKAEDGGRGYCLTSSFFSSAFLDLAFSRALSFCSLDFRRFAVAAESLERELLPLSSEALESYSGEESEGGGSSPGGLFCSWL